ncbi:MAG: hypothetical protein Ct9H90mP4_07270 [Gammaproteobacteria bacterium]|nr:MAG: hypothetical protein Ct9H90mP4_07270 [Gammaproteobacteria bacterium]
MSDLYLICPALAFETAAETSLVTVPVFGFGIRPLGPSNFPKGLNYFHGLRSSDNNIKNHQHLFLNSSAKSSIPTASAPASLAALPSSPSANTATLQDFPVPDGREVAPLTF